MKNNENNNVIMKNNWYDQIYSYSFSNCEEIKLSKAPPEK